MGRSLFRTTATTLPEAASFHHELSDTDYSIVRRENAWYQHRSQPGFDGRPANVEELSIDYVLGSGNHARSFLHRTTRGTLIELPLGWYAEKGGFFGMSPGFDTLHPATRRLISYECMFCHNGYPRIPQDHEARGNEPVFTGELPEGIDCQRCHGPGSNHVEAAGRAGAGRESIRAGIVNPARLSRTQQMEVCLQCHLQPASSGIPALIRRFDRTPFSYRAGEPLAAFQLAFDRSPKADVGGNDRFEIVGSSAYRLMQSRCFRESATLTCQTCHDPHRALRGEEADRHYSAVCSQCHAATLARRTPVDAHFAGSNCIRCHMPKRRTKDVVHVVMTDHRIQARPPLRNSAQELTERHGSDAEEYRGEIVPWYPSTLPPADRLYPALAQVLMKNNLGPGTAALERLLGLAPPGDAEWYLELGNAWLAAGESAKAVAAFERAVRLKPRSARCLQGLARALQTAGQRDRSAAVLQQAIDAAPADGAIWYQAAVLASEMRQSGEALQRMARAIELNPDQPGAYTTMGRLSLEAGRAVEAQEWLGQALQVDPGDSVAWDLAGRQLAGKKQFAEALFNFERANRFRPGFAPYLYDYALTLASAGQRDSARQTAKAATEADPNLAEAHALLGGLLAQESQRDEAAKEYRLALRLRPEFARARLDLASVLAAQGDTAGAVIELREAARGADAQVAALAVAALQRLGLR
jgi:tetratricopeptide (TPR) repeat protein